LIFSFTFVGFTSSPNGTEVQRDQAVGCVDLTWNDPTRKLKTK